MLSKDICRNNPAIGISVNAAKNAPSAPMEDSTSPIPSYNLTPSTGTSKGYDVSEYRSIYESTNSTSYNVNSGGYQCNDYKSIYDK